MRAWHALEDHELPTQLTTNPFFLKKSACTSKPVLMENIKSGTDFGAKLASSKDAVTKHSLPIKIPSPRVVLLQDPCLLKGFKELILCRGCLLPKPYRHTCSRWRNAEAGLDGSPIRAALKQWELCWLAHLTPDKLGSSLGCIC